MGTIIDILEKYRKIVLAYYLGGQKWIRFM